MVHVLGGRVGAVADGRVWPDTVCIWGCASLGCGESIGYTGVKGRLL